MPRKPRGIFGVFCRLLIVWRRHLLAVEEEAEGKRHEEGMLRAILLALAACLAELKAEMSNVKRNFHGRRQSDNSIAVRTALRNSELPVRGAQASGKYGAWLKITEQRLRAVRRLGAAGGEKALVKIGIVKSLYSMKISGNQ